MRTLDAQLYPEKLKAIAMHVQEHQAQTQNVARLQQHKQLERDLTPAHSPQVDTFAPICASLAETILHIRVVLSLICFSPFHNFTDF